MELCPTEVDCAARFLTLRSKNCDNGGETLIQTLRSKNCDNGSETLRYDLTEYQDEKPVCPDSAGGPMLPGQKKDKVCLVCGDKALGYNFNAVSCESCKAFFRRNAHKTIRGRCQGRCDVNIESRSFCKRCRLAKCFTVGMRKDMILDDDQKKQRKQKILINKLRRHGSLPPEDTYAVSETDIQQVFNQKIVPHSYETSVSAPKKANVETPPTAYEPWQDVKDNLFETIEDMPEDDKMAILEMNRAHEKSSFLSNTETKLTSLPSNVTEVFNIADGFVRRIIKVAKQVQFFRQVDKDDQIALLKGSVVEIMMLRSAVNFDIKTETWTLNTNNCIKSDSSSSGSSNVSSPASAHGEFSPKPAGFDINELRKAAMAGADFNTLRNMARGGGAGGGNLNGKNTPNFPSPPSATTLPAGLEAMKKQALAAGIDVESLRKAASNGMSFGQLSQMAKDQSGEKRDQPNESHDSHPVDLSTDSKTDVDSNSTSISSELLKVGNPETRTMFLTYSKFIRSLMSTIFGDLIVLKFLIMLSLFSPDRQGINNREEIEHCQETYARLMQAYITKKYPQETTMFARCIMKLTDLRNVNEVHTKMLLKMQVTDIEPLLVEIFDLPQ